MMRFIIDPSRLFKPSIRPRSSNIFTLLPDKASPHILSRGNLDLSIRTVFKPSLLAYNAALVPAGPAPTIITSYIRKGFFLCDTK